MLIGPTQEETALYGCPKICMAKTDTVHMLVEGRVVKSTDISWIAKQFVTSQQAQNHVFLRSAQLARSLAKWLFLQTLRYLCDTSKSHLEKKGARHF